MTLMASRSGSSSPSARSSSSAVSSSGFCSALRFVTWFLPFLRVRRDGAATRYVSAGGFFAHVGRDRRIDVSNQINAPARAPDPALDDLAKLHFLVFARYPSCQTLRLG